MIHVFRIPGISEKGCLANLKSKCTAIESVNTEYCFNIQSDAPGRPNTSTMKKIMWILTETFEIDQTREGHSFLPEHDAQNGVIVLEYGPRLAFRTAWSSNCESMFKACGIQRIHRVERSRRFAIRSSRPLTDDEVHSIDACLHDIMVECRYVSSLQSFE